MNFNAATPGFQNPPFSEGTALASPRDSRNNSLLWKKVKFMSAGERALFDQIKKLQREVSKSRRRILGGGSGGGGFDWMYPTHKELDTTLSYSTGKWAYISALNSLIVTGMTDLVSNATVTSCQGIWMALQDIPAAAGGKFNVPTLNYPSGAAVVGGSTFAPGTTAPSGTPLIGDMDLVDPTTGKPVRYWEYLGDIT